MQAHFAMFAGYNAWANERLYRAAAEVPGEEYRRDHGAFFRSLHGTLNHVLVADRIWMRRFTGTGEAPTSLDAILFEAFEPLRAARSEEDARIVGYVAGLRAGALAGAIRYRRASTPEEIVQPLGPALAHFFNHQTHHRGQAHMLLTRILGRERGPPLDLMHFQRETGTGLT